MATKEEFTVYDLQHTYEEFKNLDYWTLMKICELLAKTAGNNATIEDLEEEVSSLEDELDDATGDVSFYKEKAQDLEYRLGKALDKINDLEGQNAAN